MSYHQQWKPNDNPRDNYKHDGSNKSWSSNRQQRGSNSNYNRKYNSNNRGRGQISRTNQPNTNYSRGRKPRGMQHRHGSGNGVGGHNIDYTMPAPPLLATSENMGIWNTNSPMSMHDMNPHFPDNRYYYDRPPIPYQWQMNGDRPPSLLAPLPPIPPVQTQMILRSDESRLRQQNHLVPNASVTSHNHSTFNKKHLPAEPLLDDFPTNNSDPVDPKLPELKIFIEGENRGNENSTQLSKMLEAVKSFSEVDITLDDLIEEPLSVDCSKRSKELDDRKIETEPSSSKSTSDVISSNPEEIKNSGNSTTKHRSAEQVTKKLLNQLTSMDKNNLKHVINNPEAKYETALKINARQKIKAEMRKQLRNFTLPENNAIRTMLEPDECIDSDKIPDVIYDEIGKVLNMNFFTTIENDSGNSSNVLDQNFHFKDDNECNNLLDGDELFRRAEMLLMNDTSMLEPDSNQTESPPPTPGCDTTEVDDDRLIETNRLSDVNSSSNEDKIRENVSLKLEGTESFEILGEASTQDSVMNSVVDDSVLSPLMTEDDDNLCEFDVNEIQLPQNDSFTKNDNMNPDLETVDIAANNIADTTNTIDNTVPSCNRPAEQNSSSTFTTNESQLKTPTLETYSLFNEASNVTETIMVLNVELSENLDNNSTTKDEIASGNQLNQLTNSTTENLPLTNNNLNLESVSSFNENLNDSKGYNDKSKRKINKNYKDSNSSLRRKEESKNEKLKNQEKLKCNDKERLRDASSENVENDVKKKVPYSEMKKTENKEKSKPNKIDMVNKNNKLEKILKKKDKFFFFDDKTDITATSTSSKLSKNSYDIDTRSENKKGKSAVDKGNNKSRRDETFLHASIKSHTEDYEKSEFTKWNDKKWNEKYSNNYEHARKPSIHRKEREYSKDRYSEDRKTNRSRKEERESRKRSRGHKESPDHKNKRKKLDDKPLNDNSNKIGIEEEDKKVPKNEKIVIDHKETELEENTNHIIPRLWKSPGEKKYINVSSSPIQQPVVTNENLVKENVYLTKCKHVETQTSPSREIPKEPLKSTDNFSQTENEIDANIKHDKLKDNPIGYNEITPPNDHSLLEQMKEMDLQMMTLQRVKMDIDEKILKLQSEKMAIDQQTVLLQNKRFSLLEKIYKMSGTNKTYSEMSNQTDMEMIDVQGDCHQQEISQEKNLIIEENIADLIPKENNLIENFVNPIERFSVELEEPNDSKRSRKFRKKSAKKARKKIDFINESDLNGSAIKLKIKKHISVDFVDQSPRTPKKKKHKSINIENSVIDIPSPNVGINNNNLIITQINDAIKPDNMDSFLESCSKPVQIATISSPPSLLPATDIEHFLKSPIEIQDATLNSGKRRTRKCLSTYAKRQQKKTIKKISPLANLMSEIGSESENNTDIDMEFAMPRVVNSQIIIDMNAKEVLSPNPLPSPTLSPSVTKSSKRRDSERARLNKKLLKKFDDIKRLVNNEVMESALNEQKNNIDFLNTPEAASANFFDVEHSKLLPPDDNTSKDILSHDAVPFLKQTSNEVNSVLVKDCKVIVEKINIDFFNNILFKSNETDASLPLLSSTSSVIQSPSFSSVENITSNNLIVNSTPENENKPNRRRRSKSKSDGKGDLQDKLKHEHNPEIRANEVKRRRHKKSQSNSLGVAAVSVVPYSSSSSSTPSSIGRDTPAPELFNTPTYLNPETLKDENIDKNRMTLEQEEQKSRKKNARKQAKDCLKNETINSNLTTVAQLSAQNQNILINNSNKREMRRRCKLADSTNDIEDKINELNVSQMDGSVSDVVNELENKEISSSRSDDENYFQNGNEAKMTINNIDNKLEEIGKQKILTVGDTASLHIGSSKSNNLDKEDDKKFQLIKKEANNIDNIKIEKLSNISIINEKCIESILSLSKEYCEFVYKLNWRNIFKQHKKPIVHLEIVEKYLLAASEDGNIYRYLWDTGILEQIYSCHNDTVTFFVNVNNENIYSVSLDGTLHKFDLDDFTQTICRIDYKEPLQTVEYGWKKIYVGCRSGKIYICDIEKMDEFSEFAVSSGIPVMTLKATKEGARKILLVACKDSSVTLRDAKTGLLLRNIEISDHINIYSLVLDLNIIYCGTSQQGLITYDFMNGLELMRSRSGKGIVCMKIWNNYIITCCYDGFIYVHQKKTGIIVGRIQGPGKMLLCIDIVDNKIIASTKDNVISISDMPSDILTYMKNNN